MNKIVRFFKRGKMGARGTFTPKKKQPIKAKKQNVFV